MVIRLTPPAGADFEVDQVIRDASVAEKISLLSGKIIPRKY
jgi:hypothetical protein